MMSKLFLVSSQGEGVHQSQSFAEVIYGWSSCKRQVKEQASEQTNKPKVQSLAKITSTSSCAYDLMGYHGVSYVRKIPVMCRLHGSKDILLCQHMTMLETDKVGAGTYGHPV